MDEGLDLKPPHFKILAYIMEKGRATNEEIREVVKNPNIAVKCRQDLLKWGLIHGVKEKVGGRIVDVFYPVASSHALVYFSEVLRFLENILKHAYDPKIGSFKVFKDGSIAVFERGAPSFHGELKNILSFGAASDDFEENREQDPLSYEEKAMLLRLVFLEIPLAAGMLRRYLNEFRMRIVLASLPKDKREIIPQYQKDLESFHELYADILAPRATQITAGKNEIIKQFIEQNKEMAVMIRHAIVELFTNYLMIVVVPMESKNKNDLISHLKGLYETALKYADESQKEKVERLKMLYNRLMDENSINAYVEFSRKLRSLPRMCYIIPIGFKGHLLKFAKTAREMHEKGGYEKLHKQLVEEFFSPYYLLGEDEEGYPVFRFTPYIVDGLEESEADEF